MKGMYFLKDKKAMVYKLVSSGEVGGDEYYQAIALSPLWCYTKQLSGELLYQAKAIDPSETRLFVFCYNDQIKPQYMVKYGDNWYEITRVDRTDDYKTDCFVYVKEARKPYRPRNYNGQVEGSSSGSGSGSGGGGVGVGL